MFEHIDAAANGWRAVKVGKDQLDTLLARDGIYPAFHMNKKSWVSIIFDGTPADDEIRRTTVLLHLV